MLDTITTFRGEYRWLSNFWLVPVLFDGKLYPSVENAYQASKTLDDDARDRVRLMTPGDSKRAGKTVVVRADWEAIKLEMMEFLVWEKFKHPELRTKLHQTGDKQLIEGNYWGDIFWGVCKGVGENHLGKILMKLRDHIKAEFQL